MSKPASVVLFGIAGAAVVGLLAFLAPHVVAALGRGGPAVPTFTVTRSDFVRQVRAEGILEAAQSTVITGPLQLRGALASHHDILRLDVAVQESRGVGVHHGLQ